jgi:hypothetical protein
MRLLAVLTAVALVAACDWQRFSPGDKCWWTETQFAIRLDTAWNTTPITAIPDSMQYLWQPYILLRSRVATDSAWTCR